MFRGASPCSCLLSRDRVACMRVSKTGRVYSENLLVEHSYFAWEQRQSKDFFDERESCKDVEKNDNTGGILLTAIIIFKFDENDQTACIL